MKNARYHMIERKIYAPLQFEIGNGVRGIVITGPNTGGKTVAIKTVALNCLMAQCGLHVTCQEADICMNSAFLCDIGDGQNLMENLSTFSAHIRNALEIISEVNGESLVVMDELGSGTDPTEGMGIAISILEELRKSGCLFLVTTHYPEVKEYAAKAEAVTNARMEFDRETLKPTYRMIIGEAGESCAFYIAQKLGIPTMRFTSAVILVSSKTSRTAASSGNSFSWQNPPGISSFPFALPYVCLTSRTCFFFLQYNLPKNNNYHSSFIPRRSPQKPLSCPISAVFPCIGAPNASLLLPVISILDGHFFHDTMSVTDITGL